MSKLLFLSDIHLGGPEFVYTKPLRKALCSVFWDAIYIVGDVVDVWETDVASIQESQAEFIKMINILSQETKVIIVKGNHDPAAVILSRIFPYARVYPDEHHTQIAGEYTIICHGNKVDPANWYLRPAFDFRKYLERAFGEGLINKIAAWVKQKFYKAAYTRPWNHVDAGAVKKWADDARIIIMGHSHYAKVLITPKITYINLGRTIPPNPTYATFMDGEFKMNDLEEGDPVL